MNRFGKSSRKNMIGVNENLIQLANRVLSKSIHDFGVPRYGGVRTEEDQLKFQEDIGKQAKDINCELQLGAG